MWSIIPALAVVSLLVWMNIQAFRVRVNKEEIELQRLPSSFDGTRIFFISDLHRRSVPRRLLDKVSAAGGADLVLLGGDLREKGVPLVRTRRNLRILAEIAPLYAVYGNHDYDGRKARELDVMLQEEGVRLLVNESVFFEQEDGGIIRLAGLDDQRAGRPDIRRTLADNIETFAISSQSREICTILLAHNPVVGLQVDELAEVDLLLSGHTHGGQIALPIIGPLYRSPSILSFNRGWFTPGNTKTTEGRTLRLFVSCGFGTSRLPLRLGAPSQSHLFILRQAQHQAGQSKRDQ